MKSKSSFQKLQNLQMNARVFKREYISGRGNFCFHKPRSKELSVKNIFFFVVLGFKAERFSLELHLTKYVKRQIFVCVLFGFSLTKALKNFLLTSLILKTVLQKWQRQSAFTTLNHVEKDGFSYNVSIAIFCLLRMFVLQCLFFCLQLHKGFGKAKNTRRLSRDKIKRELPQLILFLIFLNVLVS